MARVRVGTVRGSLPVWLVLLNLKANPKGSQRQIAEAIGLSEATLAHHLNAMGADGLITRRRDPANRRVHLLEVTESGEQSFVRLRVAAVSFDRRLRRGISDEQIEQLQGVLDQLAANVGTNWITACRDPVCSTAAVRIPWPKERQRDHLTQPPCRPTIPGTGDLGRPRSGGRLNRLTRAFPDGP